MSWQDRPYYREESSSPTPLLRPPGMSVTTWLIIINSVVFVLDTILFGSGRAHELAPSTWGAFSLRDAVERWQLWRFITYQFLHDGLFHILFNMIGLYFFGPMVERWLGSRRFLAFYLLCGISGAAVFGLSALVPGLLSTFAGTKLLGASGSVFGILAAAAVIAPDARVMLLIPPIPMRLRTLVLVFLGLAVLSVLVNSVNSGGEAAHLGGAALGFLLIKQSWLLNWAGRSSFQPSLSRRGPSRFARWRQERQRRAQQQEDAEVDRILAKVKAHGLQSLTEREKRTLQRATNRQRRGE